MPFTECGLVPVTQATACAWVAWIWPKQWLHNLQQQRRYKVSKQAEVKPATNGNGPLVPVQIVEAPPAAESKFTLNLKSSGEISLTVRTNDEGELEQLLEKWEPRIIIISEPGPNGKTRYYAGDSCPHCSSKLVRRQGRNGKFIGCVTFPNCQFTAPL